MARTTPLGRALALVALAGLAGPVAPQPAPPGAVEVVPVVPVPRWDRFERVEWDGGVLEVHLRTGHARPLILPEAVTLEARAPLPGCDVTIDREVVLFEPGAHFAPEELVLVGTETRARYRLRVRSSAYGARVPLEILR